MSVTTTFIKTGKPFFIQKPRLPGKRNLEGPGRMFSQYPSSTKAAAKVPIQQEHCYAKPLAPDFQIQVSELVHKINF